MEKTVPVRSLKKALDILDLIIEADMHKVEASLARLAKWMRMPNNSVHNLLKTMVTCGYVSNSGHGIYVQGVKCRQLGLLNRLTVPVVHESILAILKQFAARTREGCLLTTLLNGDRVVVARVDSTQAIQVSHATIEDHPFFARATGRILAAFATPEELSHIVDRHGMPGPHWKGITTEAALKKALVEVRQQGWSHVDTREEGLVGLGCPVFSSSGQVWGALGLYAPAFRCQSGKTGRLIKDMVKLAKELSVSLPEKPVVR